LVPIFLKKSFLVSPTYFRTKNNDDVTFFKQHDIRAYDYGMINTREITQKTPKKFKFIYLAI